MLIVDFVYYGERREQCLASGVSSNNIFIITMNEENSGRSLFVTLIAINATRNEESSNNIYIITMNGVVLTIRYAHCSGRKSTVNGVNRLRLLR